MTQHAEPMFIAGWLTADDWWALRPKLDAVNGTGPWDVVYRDFFLERLKLRYLESIATLQQMTYRGEGFSIVAIQCGLIEFMAATHKGQAYRSLKKGEKVGLHEYSASGALFTEFLATVAPFDGVFDADSADDFYRSVRCGLLHEASTKNGWRIHASGAQAIDVKRKIVFRNELQLLIEGYVTSVDGLLQTSARTREAILRKFDALATREVATP
jgi:hypothetical protein